MSLLPQILLNKGWLGKKAANATSAQSERQSEAQSIGQWAENQALDFLQDHSLRLQHRNYRCKFGEIDLIMVDNHQTLGQKTLAQKTLVFVEVRYRKHASHGSPLESVDGRKQRKLVATARHYLQKHGLSEKINCRFDVVAVESMDARSKTRNSDADNGNAANIDWIADAFTA